MYESLMNNKEYWQAFLEQLWKDYDTPRFRTEVVFDTLLLPGILEELVEKSLGIKAKYITKEFSILTKRYKQSSEDNQPNEDNKSSEDNNSSKDANSNEDKRNFCVDYLLYDQDRVYFVELKTDKASINSKQKKRYQEIAENYTFEKLYDDYTGKITDKDSEGKYIRQRAEVTALGEILQNKKEIGLIYILILPGKKNQRRTPSEAITSSDRIELKYEFPGHPDKDKNNPVINLSAMDIDTTGYSKPTQIFLEICKTVLAKKVKQ